MIYENAIAWGVFGALATFCAAHLSEPTKRSRMEAATACVVTAMYGAAFSWAFSLPFSPLRPGFYLQLVAMIALSGIMAGCWRIVAAWTFVALCGLVGTFGFVFTYAVPVATALIAGLLIMTFWGVPAVAMDTLWKLLLSYAVFVVAAIVLRLVGRPSRA